LPKFLTSVPARVVTLLLIVHAVLLYSAIRPEVVPTSRPLAQVPKTLASWQLIDEGVVEPEVQEVLQADDLLNRFYGKGTDGAGLFVAAFKTQRTGKAPHSPKNCLPGSGWTPLASGELTVDLGQGPPITVNRYIVTSGDKRELVLYWYQSRDRVVASEYRAKFWVMMDAMRLNRTDTALVRVIVPIIDNNDARSERTAVDFVQSFFPTLREYLPA